MKLRQGLRRPTPITLALALTVACTAEDELTFDELAEDSHDELGEDEIDEDFRVQYAAMTTHFEVVQDDSVASKATGVVVVPFRDGAGNFRFHLGKQVRGTCGVTFISPHYAVTSAHCVPSNFVPDPVNNTLWVLQYDASDVHPWWFAFASVLDGTFPNYEPLANLYDSGIVIDYHVCKVASRCDDTFGRYNCADDPATGADNFDDVALLHCPSRSAPQWLGVANSDAGTGNPVEMYWFHELIDMPVNDPGVADPEGSSRFDHYTRYKGSGLAHDNLHYLESPANFVLPLRSKPWSDGSPRRRVSGTVTDLYGCHGTSGSGVLQRNASNNLELLGPVAHGYWASDRLCANPNAAPGSSILDYESNEATRRLQSKFSWTLRWDRDPIVIPWPPIGPIGSVGS